MFRHFRRAAERNDPEGLYNMGVFYDNGFEDIVVNKTMAYEYFSKSAHHHRPFTMALEVVGHYHMGNHGIVSVWSLVCYDTLFYVFV